MVIEGAGSPAEINLVTDDFVNMGMAEIADAPVILVADIDRGGVFAALYGTIMLLDESDRKRVKGLVINKFRGDIDLLMPGIEMFKKYTDIPIIGIIPYIRLDFIEESVFARSLQDSENRLQIEANMHETIDILANHVKKHIDMDFIYKIISTDAEDRG